MKNNAVKFGILAGLITATFTVIGATLMAKGSNGSGYNNSEVLGYTGIFLALSLIIVAMFKERQLKGGAISYLQTFLVGLKISLIASVFYIVAWSIMTTIYPDVLNGMFQVMEDNLKSDKLSPETLKDQLRQLEMYKGYYADPLLKPVVLSIEIFPWGLLISLIAAVFFSSTTTAYNEKNKYWKEFI